MKNLWSKMKKEPDKWIFRILLAAFLISMVPVWYIARYTVPGCDDYTYGVRTHGAWLATGSLLAVLKAAIETTVEYWFNWQGTYSSIFLMTLSPGILSEKWYFLTTFLMTGMLGGSIACLVHVVLKRYVGKVSGYQRGICTLVLLFLTFQTMVAPNDGLFWYNGALHYVFMESVLFFQIAVLLSFRKAGHKSAGAGYLLLSVFLAFVLGGANLLTGLQSCILTVFLLLYSIWVLWSKKKEYVSAEKKQLWVLLPLFVNLAGFGLNVMAPGNAVRETTAEGMGAIKAVTMSFYWAASYLTEWMTPIVLAGFLLLCPVIWSFVKRAETKFFRPLYAAVLSFCVFAAMFTPTLYASSSDGPPRCKNIMCAALYLLVFFNLVNTFGWFAQNRKDSLLCALQSAAEKNYLSWLAVFGVVTGCLFVLAADKNTYVGISALRSLANGEAAQYYEENAARLALYNDESLPDVTVSYLNAKPYLLFREDVGNEGSPDYWINISIVDYYQKNSLTVEGEQEGLPAEGEEP